MHRGARQNTKCAFFDIPKGTSFPNAPVLSFQSLHFPTLSRYFVTETISVKVSILFKYLKIKDMNGNSYIQQLHMFSRDDEFIMIIERLLSRRYLNPDLLPILDLISSARFAVKWTGPGNLLKCGGGTKWSKEEKRRAVLINIGNPKESLK